MKKSSLMILIGLLFFCFGFSPHEAVIARKKATAYTCPADGSPDIENRGDGVTEYLGSSDGYYYAGQTTFTVASEKKLCKVDFSIYAINGTITGLTYYAQVWTMTGTALNELQGESTGVTGSQAWAEDTELYFTFPTPVTLSISTNYAIVITRKGYSDPNYIRIQVAETSTLNGSSARWNGDGVEQAAAATNDVTMGLYWYD